MKQTLTRLEKKFDSLDDGRRRLLFIAVAVIFAAAAHFLFVNPLISEQKRILEKLAQTRSLAGKVNSQIESTVKAFQADPDSDSKVRLATLRAKLAEDDAILLAMQKGLIAPAKMADLLEKMLQQNPGVKLVEMHSIPASGAASDGKEQKAKAADPGQVLFRQGVAITVRGTFFDLLQYLSGLEKLPWQIYWDKMEFKVDEFPAATLSLTVHTLSLEKAWLSI